MADTVFNIFGSHFSGPVQRPLVPKIIGENANVLKKPGLLTHGLTPSKLNKNISTPKLNDPKRKTFFQNEGASIQSFHQSSDTKKTAPSTFKKTLQVYEDEIVTEKPDNEFDELLKIEYNRRPIVDDDGSDDEMTFTKEQVDQLIFGLPSNNYTPTPTLDRPKMFIPQTQDCDNFNEFLPDDESDLDDYPYDDADIMFQCNF